MMRVTVTDPLARDERWLRWLRMHAVNPLNTYEVEVDTTSMRVHQYATRLQANTTTLKLEWRKYPDRTRPPHPAYRPPFSVTLITPPPEP